MNYVERFVRTVDMVNYRVGRFAMYFLFAMMAVLLWSSFSKFVLTPSLWTLEVAQFLMVAYYFLGGPYAMQMGSNVRMDVFYGSWSDRTKAMVDCLTIFALIFYLSVLLYGGIQSAEYALKYNERSPTAWRPFLAPIKILMCVALVLMMFQAVASFLRNFASLKGLKIPTVAEQRGHREKI